MAGDRYGCEAARWRVTEMEKAGNAPVAGVAGCQSGQQMKKAARRREIENRQRTCSQSSRLSE